MQDSQKVPKNAGKLSLENAGRDSKPLVADETIDLDSAKPEKTKRHWLPAFWYRWSRRRKILVVLASLAVIIAAVGAVYTNFVNTSQGSSTPKKAVAAKPKTVASPLTGVQVTPDLAKRPVTGIMIENSPDARPQSGIQDAGVIFEAIAEGGITRFMTLYQDAQPQYIGPVRSLRPYFLDMAAPFQAGIVHVGVANFESVFLGQGVNLLEV